VAGDRGAANRADGLAIDPSIGLAAMPLNAKRRSGLNG
jgi:hypothetical protein